MKQALFLLLLAFLISGCGSGDPSAQSVNPAELDRSTRPAPAPAPESSFPEYNTTQTEQGLTIYSIESERQPVITYRLLFRTGGLFDDDKPGLAEFVASMLD